MLLLLSRKWACPVVKLPFRLALHKHSAMARQQGPSKLIPGLLCRNTFSEKILRSSSRASVHTISLSKFSGTPYLSLELSLSLSSSHYARFTTLNYIRRRVGPLDDSPASARPSACPRRLGFAVRDKQERQRVDIPRTISWSRLRIRRYCLLR